MKVSLKLEFEISEEMMEESNGLLGAIDCVREGRIGLLSANAECEEKSWSADITERIKNEIMTKEWK